jgi:hypothetical protein
MTMERSWCVHLDAIVVLVLFFAGSIGYYFYMSTAIEPG